MTSGGFSFYDEKIKIFFFLNRTPPLTFVFVMKSFYGSCYYGHDIIIGLSMMTVDHESG